MEKLKQMLSSVVTKATENPKTTIVVIVVLAMAVVYGLGVFAGVKLK